VKNAQAIILDFCYFVGFWIPFGSFLWIESVIQTNEFITHNTHAGRGCTMAFRATTTTATATTITISSLPYLSFIIIATFLFNCCESFEQSRCAIHSRVHHRYRGGRCHVHDNNNNHEDGQIISSYNETDASSKGLVSTLTIVVNWFMGTRITKTTPPSPSREPLPPPGTPTELLDRIREDYTTHNYLWTGNIDLSSFEPDCRFTDPTLSFVGTGNFVKNVQNLAIRPDVHASDG
jgi:hypothetical protein